MTLTFLCRLSPLQWSSGSSSSSSSGCHCSHFHPNEDTRTSKMQTTLKTSPLRQECPVSQSELQCKRARRTDANDGDVVLVSCPISGGDVEGNEYARCKKRVWAPWPHKTLRHRRDHSRALGCAWTAHLEAGDMKCTRVVDLSWEKDGETGQSTRGLVTSGGVVKATFWRRSS